MADDDTEDQDESTIANELDLPSTVNLDPLVFVTPTDEVAASTSSTPLLVSDEAFLVQETPENEADPHPVVFLPTEMISKIITKLDAQDVVRSTLLVSRRWNLVSKQTMLNQIREVEEGRTLIWNKKDLKAYMPKFSSQVFEDRMAQFANERGISIEFLRQLQGSRLLQFFHRTFFETYNEIELHMESVRCLLQDDDALPSCDNSLLKILAQTVPRARMYDLVFMPCHNLILCPTDRVLAFFGKLSNGEWEAMTRSGSSGGHGEENGVGDEEGDEFLYYNIDPVDDDLNEDDDNNLGEDALTEEINGSFSPSADMDPITGNISVHEDIILSQGLAHRSVWYFRVKDVDHANKKVKLDFIREIFTPFYINTSLYYNGKIYILYESSPFVGRWTESSDVLELSDTALPDTPSNKRSFCRIGNIIFIFQLNDNPATCMCLDGNGNSFELRNVEMSALVMSIVPNLRDQRYRNVSKVYGFNNIFIAVCHPVPGGAAANAPNAAIAPMLIVAAVMKRQPEMEDFASVENFKSLFFLRRSKSLKLMGTFKGDLFYFQDNINLVGEDEGGPFLLRVVKTVTSEP